MNGRLSPLTLRLNVLASPVNEDDESQGQRYLAGLHMFPGNMRPREHARALVAPPDATPGTAGQDHPAARATPLCQSGLAAIDATVEAG